MRRLLILACSQKKSTAPGDSPAVERYDGPAFRVLRKHLRDRTDPDLTILILSAEYGLIDSARTIPHYDRRMSAKRAVELRQRVLAVAKRVLCSACWQGIAVCAGRDYRLALDGIVGLVSDGVRIHFLGGGRGRGLTKLAAWLRGLRDERSGSQPRRNAGEMQRQEHEASTTAVRAITVAPVEADLQRQPTIPHAGTGKTSPGSPSVRRPTSSP